MAVQSIPDAPFVFSSFSGHPSPAAMCAADDVFHMGMVLPFGAAPPPTPARRRGSLRLPPGTTDDESSPLPRRVWRGGPAQAEYRRLRSASEHSSDSRAPPKPRPSRCLCVLGSMRVPATMDLREIRSRQRGLSPAADAGALGGDANRGATWKLLRSLSCKGVESTDVVAAAPFAS